MGVIMVKIAISLPDGIYEDLEKSRVERGVSRSEYIRVAVEERLRQETERDDVARYVKAYQQHPETVEEVTMAESTLHGVFAENPWQEEPSQ